MIWLVIFFGPNVKHHTLEPPLKVSSATGWLQKSRCAMGFTQSPPSGNSFQVSGALGSHCSVGLWKSIASMAQRRLTFTSHQVDVCPLTVSDTVPVWTIEFTGMLFTAEKKYNWCLGLKWRSMASESHKAEGSTEKQETSFYWPLAVSSIPKEANLKEFTVFYRHILLFWMICLLMDLLKAAFPGIDLWQAPPAKQTCRTSHCCRRHLTV